MNPNQTTVSPSVKLPYFDYLLGFLKDGNPAVEQISLVPPCWNGRPCLPICGKRP